MIKLIIKTGSTNEFSEGCEYALVDLTPELIAKIHRRKAVLESIRETDGDIHELVFHSLDAAYFSTFPEQHEEQLDEDLNYADAGWLPAPDGFTIEPERTECDRMVITEYGVHWRCYPKHCDWMVTTHELDYAAIEAFSAKNLSTCINALNGEDI